MNNKHTLNDKQEQLICKYFDGQAGFWSSRKAKSLIAKNPDAAEFYNELQGITEKMQDLRYTPESTADELWNKISARIEQEERAQFYLGERPAQAERRKAVWDKHPVFSAMGAAACAFVLGILVKQQFLIQPTSNPQMIAKTESEEVKKYPRRLDVITDNATTFQASTGSQQKQALRPIEGELELDWVKSDGRVRVIKVPGKGNIIWIKRKVNPNRAAPKLYTEQDINK